MAFIGHQWMADLDERGLYEWMARGYLWSSSSPQLEENCQIAMYASDDRCSLLLGYLPATPRYKVIVVLAQTTPSCRHLGSREGV